jgi:hypothetical protein
VTGIPTYPDSPVAIEPLSQQLAALLEQLEYMEQQEQPYLIALYQSSLGELEYRLLNLQVECRLLQQRIELAMIRLNRGELLTRQHLGEIEQQVQQALLEWQAQLAAQSQAMTAGRVYLAGLVPANPHDVQRSKQAYRRLARLLHPDINPDQQTLFEQYWPSIQKAYCTYDADMLEALLHVVTCSLSPAQQSEPDDTVMFARLSALIARHSERLIQLRNEMPFCWAEVLQNADWIAARQADLEAEIEAESQRWAHLLARYADIGARVAPET